MNNSEVVLERIKSAVNTTAPDSQVFLFGSRARGSAGKTSDWDLLVLVNRKKISFSDETEFMNLFYELELETGEVLSPIIYSKSDWKYNYSKTPLYENIMREGIRIL